MLKFRSVLVPAGLLAVFAFSPVSASPMDGTPAAAMHRHDPMERFAAMDGDSDGRVSSAEFFKARPSMTEKAFGLIDSDGDGFVSKEEWSAFSSGHGGNAGGPGMEAMMKGMRGMGGPRPAGDGAGECAGTGMPLVMPPEAKGASVPQGMPLVMPPAPAAGKGKAPERSVPLVMPPAE